jgi:hypothetical protein
MDDSMMKIAVPPELEIISAPNELILGIGSVNRLW